MLPSPSRSMPLSSSWCPAAGNDGWGPSSRLRPVDLSVCFEDGVFGPLVLVLSSTLVLAWIWRERRRSSLPDLTIRSRTAAKLIVTACLLATHVLLATLYSKSPVAALHHALSAALVLPLLITAEWIEETSLPAAGRIVGVSVATAAARALLCIVETIRARTAFLVAIDATVASTIVTSDEEAASLSWDAVWAAAVWALTATGAALHFSTVGKPAKYTPVGTPQVLSKRPLQRSMFSHLTFGFMTGLMKLGVRRTVVKDDLWALDNEFEASNVFSLFINSYHPTLSDTSLVPFFRALVPLFGWEYLVAIFFLGLSTLIDLMQPVVIEMILKYISAAPDDKQYPPSYGWTTVALMLILAVCSPPTKEQYFHRMTLTTVKIRTGIVGAVFAKSLRLSSSARQEYSQGRVQTLQSVDAEVIQRLGRTILLGIRAPFQILATFYLLSKQLGFAFIPGVFVLLMSTPIQVKLNNRAGEFEKKRLVVMDERIKWMGEFIKGILVVKFNTWEEPVLKIVKTLRLAELQNISKSLIFQSLSAILLSLNPQLIAIACFGTYALISATNPTDTPALTPSKVFVTLALLRLLASPINWIRDVFITFKRAGISARRVDDFLRAEEVEPPEPLPVMTSPRAESVSIHDARFAWTKNGPTSVWISDFSVAKGELVAVVGRIGEGKSSLVNAMLGEMHKLEGICSLSGSVAYAAQQAWIVSGTIRENILFGKPWDAVKFQKIIQACALERDLDLLPAGDRTEIGERGINLSGGQRQRISLARALYSDADIYVLDDPLSAVDMHVDSHIFHSVIGPKGLLAERARVLVTHGLHHLSTADKVAVLKAGRIVESGRFSVLAAEEDKQSELASLARVLLSDERSLGRQDAVVTVAGNAVPNEIEVLDTSFVVTRNSSGNNLSESEGTVVAEVSVTDRVEASSATTAEPTVAAGPSTSVGGLTVDEDQGTGSVGWRAYAQYIRAFSITGMGLCIGLLIFGSVVNASASWWLGYWSSAHEHDQMKGLPFYLGVYVGLVATYAIVATVTNYCFRAVFGLRAATILHDGILQAIIHAPMSFFNVTPTGRIINRFSKDLEIVCDTLPVTFYDTLYEAVIVLAGVVVCSLATPFYIFLVLPLAYPYAWLQRHYLPTSRDLRRLHAITRSPIYQLLSETLDGLSTIRAYGAQEQFIQLLVDRVNLNNNAHITNYCTNRWFDVRIDMVGLFAMVISAALCVASKGSIDAAMAGLALTYAMSTAGYLSFCVQDFSMLEVNIVAVERINEYIDCPQEAPRLVSPPPPAGWPSRGALMFENYSTRYRDNLDLVLRDLTLSISPGERVGVVGRTGSGKSTLVLAVTRVLEAAAGRILLDGVDVSQVGIRTLRESVTVVPQEPLLFATSLRENLDPFSEFSDAEIWRALDRVQMGSWASGLEGKLDAMIAEGGTNLSVGERQLLCMAKAVLRSAKVLMLDEATSSVDVKTDELIQRLLREEFADSTIICIAHRINTILGFDRILVVDAGRIVEFDRPAALLGNQDSLFASLCRQYRANVAGVQDSVAAG
ncbi:P-loop containing nucleoside triphosphate hydrolase protein [Zopfochytrium polystomum]|nr:P-loop containing nucleoside triphosphate hydrolase protein [Zopfochytrium polystomum]